MDDKYFAVLFEELRLLRAEVAQLKNSLVQLPIPEAKPTQNYGLDYRITDILRDLGIPTHVQGYSMVRTAINLVYHDQTLLNGLVTKVLYPSIAKMYNSTETKVERAIGYSITASWRNNRKHSFYTRFKNRRPSNSEFIALIVDKFMLEKSEEENELCQKTS